MVTRTCFALVVAAALSACPPPGDSCGRGRCPQGACIRAIATYPPSEAYQLDAWCVVPCPGAMGCDGVTCLQNATDWNTTICAGDQMEVKYRYATSAQVRTGFNGGEPILETLRSIQINEAHVDGGTVTCMPDQTCSAGWYRSGEFLPTVTAVTASGKTVTVGNGTPGEHLPPMATADERGTTAPLGPLLPTGLDIVVNVGGRVDKQL